MFRTKPPKTSTQTYAYPSTIDPDPASAGAVPDTSIDRRGADPDSCSNSPRARDRIPTAASAGRVMNHDQETRGHAAVAATYTSTERDSIIDHDRCACSSSSSTMSTTTQVTAAAV